MIEYRESAYIQNLPMQKMKVLAQFYDPLTPCAKIFMVIKKFAPPPSKIKYFAKN